MGLIGEPIHLPGRLTISRTQSTVSGDRVTIRLVDEVSGISFVELSLSLAAFAAAITGLGDVHAEMELRGLDVVGMRHEAKTETVDLPDQFTRGEEFQAALRELVAPLEVDGWKASIDRSYNPHRSVSRVDGTRGYGVHFHRYVDATEADIEERRKNRRDYGAPWERS